LGGKFCRKRNRLRNLLGKRGGGGGLIPEVRGELIKHKNCQLLLRGKRESSLLWEKEVQKGSREISRKNRPGKKWSLLDFPEKKKKEVTKGKKKSNGREGIYCKIKRKQKQKTFARGRSNLKLSYFGKRARRSNPEKGQKKKTGVEGKNFAAIKKIRAA